MHRAQVFILLLLVEHSLGNCGALDGFLVKALETNPVTGLVNYQTSVSDSQCMSAFYKHGSTFLIDINKEMIVFNFDHNLANDENLFFIFIDEDDNVTDVLETISTFVFWKRRQKMIFIGNFTEDQIIKYSKESFVRYWTTNIAFVDCEFKQITRYNPFSQVLLTDENPNLLYERVADNLYGFPLKIEMFSNIIAIWTGDHYVGRDGYMILEILKHLNATPQYIHVDMTSYGRIYKNGSMTGMLKDIYMGEADAAFNTRFMSHSVFGYVDFTFSHDKDMIVIYLPIKVEELGNFLGIIPRIMLIFGGLILLIFSIYLRFYSHSSYLKIFIMNMQVITGRSVDILNKPLFKLFLSCIIFYYFVLSNIFQARLVSVLTIAKKEAELTRIKEVAQTNYKFNSESFCAGIFSSFEGEGYDSFQSIMSRNTYLPTIEFIFRMSNCLSNEGFMTTYKLGYDYTGRFKDENGFRKNCYYQVEQDLVPVRSSFIIRYGSPIYYKINEIILRILSAGLLEYWEKNQRPVFTDDSLDSPKKIRLENVASCFLILSVGYIISFIVFLYEIGLFSRLWKHRSKLYLN